MKSHISAGESKKVCAPPAKKRGLGNLARLPKRGVDKASPTKWHGKNLRCLYLDEGSDLVRNAQCGISKVLRQREKAGARGKPPDAKLAVNSRALKRKAPAASETEKLVRARKMNFIEKNIKYVQEMSKSRAASMVPSQQPSQLLTTQKDLPRGPPYVRYTRPGRVIRNVFSVEHEDGDVKCTKPRPCLVHKETRYLRAMGASAKKENVVLPPQQTNGTELKNATENTEPTGDGRTTEASKNSPGERSGGGTALDIDERDFEHIGDCLVAEKHIPFPSPSTDEAGKNVQSLVVRKRVTFAPTVTIFGEENQKGVDAKVAPAMPQEAVVPVKTFLRKQAGAHTRQFWLKKNKEMATALLPTMMLPKKVDRLRMSRACAGFEKPKPLSGVARVPLQKLMENPRPLKPSEGIEKKNDAKRRLPKSLLPKKSFVFNPHLAEPKRKVTLRKKEKPWKPIWGSSMERPNGATLGKRFTPYPTPLGGKKFVGCKFPNSSYEEGGLRRREGFKKKPEKRHLKAGFVGWASKQGPLTTEKDSQDEADYGREDIDADDSVVEKKKVKRSLKKTTVKNEKSVDAKTRRPAAMEKNFKKARSSKFQ